MSTTCHTLVVIYIAFFITAEKIALLVGAQNENISVAEGYSCVEDGSWVEASRVCDNITDCSLGDDEAFCVRTSPQPCPDDAAETPPVYSCLDGQTCLLPEYFCDEYIDCDTLEDEMNCDEAIAPGCHVGQLQITCDDVTLGESYDAHIPNNIRFISMTEVYPPPASGLGPYNIRSLIDLTKFPYLVKLYLIKTNLSDLHLGKPNTLLNLWSLYVSGNNIETVDASMFAAAPNLMHLNIGDNNITAIEPGTFQELTSLTHLSLHGNKMAVLHAGTFRGLSSVQLLNLDSIPLQTIEPGALEGLGNLTSLSLNGHNMAVLQAGTFGGLSSLHLLNLDNIPLQTIEQGAFEGLDKLTSLELSHNKLEFIPAKMFRGLSTLRHLAIVHNNLLTLQKHSFLGLENLQLLNLVEDNISVVEPGAFEGLNSVSFLDLGNNSFTELGAGTFRGLPMLKSLQMAYVTLKYIEPGAFEGLSNLVTLNMLHADLESPDMRLLDGLDNLTSLSTSDYRLCCLLLAERNASCNGPTKSFSSCQRLMPNPVLKVAIWLLGLSSIVGNIYVISERVFGKKDLTVQGMLITNLAFSDVLMGAYMVSLGVADAYFGGGYFLVSEAWRTGAWCKALGFISVLSSEASVFLIMIISIDRFSSIAFPFSRFRLEKRFIRILTAASWLVAFGLALVATLMARASSSFYGLSDVCVGLPLITTPVNESAAWIYSRETQTYVHNSTADSTQPAWAFSVFLYLGLNMVCFVVVLICYVAIFIIVHRSSKSVSKTGAIAVKVSTRNGTHSQGQSGTARSIAFSREVKLASRMAIVVGTDFICWMPVIIMGILTQSGLISVSVELYAWTVVFIIPINSSLNPYLYTISEVYSRRKKLNRNSAGATRMVRLAENRNGKGAQSVVNYDTLATSITRRESS